MKIYGTPTSPFVRRVRVVALELGLAAQLIDTRGEGQAALRALSPVWKVPVLVRDGREPLLDSRAIVDSLLREHGPGRMRAPTDLDAEANLVNVIDGALDAMVNVYTLELDGLDGTKVPYLVKQRERAEASLAWIAARLRGPWLTEDERLGPAELALHTSLDWYVFRNRWAVDTVPALAAFRAFHAKRPSFLMTVPHP